MAYLNTNIYTKSHEYNNINFIFYPIEFQLGCNSMELIWCTHDAITIMTYL